jgi:predicted metalloprotease with PDZ domain
MSFGPSAADFADPARPMYLRRELSRSYYDYADPESPRQRRVLSMQPYPTVSGVSAGPDHFGRAQPTYWDAEDHEVPPSIRMEPPTLAAYRLHPYFGVAVKSDPKPCIVAEVLPDSPAMKAGIRPGYRLLSWDGAPLKSDGDWRARVNLVRVGDRVVLRLHRDGETHTVPVEIDGLDPKQAPKKFPFFGINIGHNEDDASNRPVVPSRPHPYFGVAVTSNPEPCFVAEVLPDSPAMKAGIRPGDRLLSWNGVPVVNDAEWRTRVIQLQVGERVVLLVGRKGKIHKVPVVIEALDPKRAPTKFPFFGLESDRH